MSVLYNRIIELCNQNNITGYRLCKDVNISPNLITELRKGRRSGVSAETASKIATYFGVSVNYLLGEEESAEEELFDKHRILMHRVGKIENKLSEADKKMMESILGSLEEKYAD